MPFERTQERVADALRTTFAEVDAYFDHPEDLRRRQPASGGWSIDQILEHITLTNRFLMLTLQKWVGIAEQRVQRGDAIPEGESDLDRLDAIATHGSFGWPHPEHMTPTGEPTSAEVRALLHEQLGECLAQLERLRGGAGATCKITMTVNDLGKIDLYQWLYFIAQHERRHLQQLAALANPAV